MNEHTVVFYHGSKAVAAHKRSQHNGQHSSEPAHMPANHQIMLEWSPECLLSCASSIGPYTSHWVHEFIRQAEHPALLCQAKTYGKERLEAACLRGHLTGANRLHNIRTMLKTGLERQSITQTKHDPL